MTRYIKFMSAALAMLAFTVACNKVGNLPFYAAGNAPELTSSVTEVAPTVADSSNTVITFSWTDPAYPGIDSSNEKYVVELDSAGRNFMKAVQFTVTGSRSLSLTGTQLNNVLVAWGLTLNTANNIDVRVISSHANNNEQLISNVVTVKMTPYALPFPLTASNAGPVTITIQNKNDVVESFNWNSPGYTNASYTYELQYDTAGGDFSSPNIIATDITDSSYSIIASDLNGYAMAAGIQAGTSGALAFRVVSTINGKQKLPSDVKTVSVQPNVLLAVLYVPGDYQGWDPASAPLLAPEDAIAYEGYVYVPSGGSYEFKITDAPDWSHTAYGGSNGTLSTSGGNLVWPNGGNYYLMKANTTDLTWSAVVTNWGIVGDATPGGWNNSTAMNYDAANKVWVINSVALNAGLLKFRANNAWDINLGGDLDKLSYGGDNIQVAASGNYKIVLNLSNPLSYTATLTKL